MLGEVATEMSGSHILSHDRRRGLAVLAACLKALLVGRPF